MTRDSQGSGDDPATGEPEPDHRGGGLPLHGLKRWRLRRGFSQAELALRSDVTPDYLFKVESGRRGCNPEAAHELAAVLEVGSERYRDAMTYLIEEAALRGDEHTAFDDEGDQHVHGYASYFFTMRALELLEGRLPAS